MTSVLDRPHGRHTGAAPRRRLVVVGNGMAGARAVEEILARGGADQFIITMFGDEPYGNYNRIMLSHVLSGEESDADIFLNALSWYRENSITLHAGRPCRPDRQGHQARLLQRRPGDAVRHPHHRHGQPLPHAADGRPLHAWRVREARRLRVPHHR